MSSEKVKNEAYGDSADGPSITPSRTRSSKYRPTSGAVKKPKVVIGEVAVEPGSWDGTTHYSHAETKKSTSKKVEVKMKKESKELQELNRPTLASYIKKAALDASLKRQIAGNMERRKDAAKKDSRKQSWSDLSHEWKGMARKREAGLNKAADRLAKEEVEQVNEISNELLQRYKEKAGAEVDNPATPSKTKLKRGYGHLMATIKQMKSGKPMPPMKEQKDEREYDYEGDMAKTQLKTLIRNAQRMHDMLGNDDNLPEWVQTKIALAKDYIVNATNYLESEMKEETTSEQVDYKISMPGHGESPSVEKNKMGLRTRKRYFSSRIHYNRH